MGLYNFLDDQEDWYENVWECLDFPPKPEYESGQGVASAPAFWFSSFHSVYMKQNVDCFLFGQRLQTLINVKTMTMPEAKLRA